MIDLVERGNVGVLHMRHGKANVLDVEFCGAITGQLEELRDSPARALVLTGEGRIFSAGVDLLRVLDGGRVYLQSFLPALSRTFETIFCFPKPVVAAINGHAIAGGCVLACAADHRVMAQGSGRIGVTELLVGVPFPTSALEIMRSAAAPRHFQAMLYGGTTLSPDEAAEQGLVNAIAEQDKLLDQAVGVAETLAALPPAAFALTKRQIHEPVMKRIRESGAGFDAAVAELWAAPETLAAIREYVARTFKRPMMDK